MNKWEAQIPKTPKTKDIKRCYRIWSNWTIGKRPWRAGGKVVWLTGKQLTLAQMKYPDKVFEEVLEKDSIQYFKQYMHHTIE